MSRKESRDAAGLSSGSHRPVVQDHHLLRAQRQLGVSTTRVVGKFDLKDVWGECLNDGAHLPTAQASVREILGPGLMDLFRSALLYVFGFIVMLTIDVKLAIVAALP